MRTVGLTAFSHRSEPYRQTIFSVLSRVRRSFDTDMENMKLRAHVAISVNGRVSRIFVCLEERDTRPYTLYPIDWTYNFVGERS